MPNERLLTIIPARGGSKGLPRKNLRRFGDAPLFAWSYYAWRDAGLPGRCWLSTDDEELAELGRAIGIEVPFMRPAALATDSASAVTVLLHAVDEFVLQTGGDPEWVLLLQPTSPLRPPAVLTEACSRINDRNDVDAIVGVKVLYRSASTLYYEDDHKFMTPTSDSPKEIRRQDVRPLLTPNGALYLIRTEVLKRERTVIPPRTIALTMDSIASIDIDDASDWQLAESVVTSGNAWRLHSTAYDRRNSSSKDCL